MSTQVFALFFANRGFFPGSLIAGARDEMSKAVKKAGFDSICLDPSLTKFGAVETANEGKIYARFLKEHEGGYDGVVVCLPNFGDENGAVAALRDAGVPILIQAYPDEIGKMDFEHRRDSFCGKLSIEDMFNQYGIKYSVYPPHVVQPLSKIFETTLLDFAATCRIVKKLKRFTIGAIGARTTAFKTVRFDEIALQKYGINVETYDLSELFSRIRSMQDSCEKVKDKKHHLSVYCNCSNVPDDKLSSLAKMGVTLDDMIAEYNLDTVALRCWNEMHQEFGIAPCVLLSELNDRKIPVACEVDVNNAVTMYALQEASQVPAACLDWNNNYGDDPENRCILFHCGSIAQQLMAGKGTLGVHKMFAKGNDPDCGWGVNEGRIAAMPMTYSSAATMDGKLYVYAGIGEMTADPIEKEFFGCAGVAKIERLQEKLIYMGRNGYRHHTTMTKGHHLNAIEDAFKNYLNYQTTILK